MIIRPAKVADSERISELWLDLVNYHRDLDANMPTAAQDGHLRYAQRIRYSLNDLYQRVLVAEENGDLLGYATGMIIDIVPEMFLEERAGLIGDIYVLPTQRGKGVGTALMQVMKGWFNLRGVTHYELSVASTNQSGIRFWQEKMRGTPIMLRMRILLDEE
ncbi:MAG: GNAT family N-acetyltransferase [Anaerolineae bacterium]|nr:GNAT family N-acetyltransferase [Anaerolineae bacterium]